MRKKMSLWEVLREAEGAEDPARRRALARFREKYPKITNDLVLKIFQSPFSEKGHVELDDELKAEIEPNIQDWEEFAQDLSDTFSRNFAGFEFEGGTDLRQYQTPEFKKKSQSSKQKNYQRHGAESFDEFEQDDEFAGMNPEETSKELHRQSEEWRQGYQKAGSPAYKPEKVHQSIPAEEAWTSNPEGFVGRRGGQPANKGPATQQLTPPPAQAASLAKTKSLSLSNAIGDKDGTKIEPLGGRRRK